MRHARCKQTNRAELVGLSKLRLQRHALGNVVDQNDTAHRNKVARQQRRDSDVGRAQFAGACSQTELVEMMNALLVAETVRRLNKLSRENILYPLSDRLSAAQRIHGFHLRV